MCSSVVSRSVVDRALRISIVDGILFALMLGASESYFGACAVSLGHGDTALALLATGDRRAILSWSRFAAEGAWVWRWKDAIDRRFMARYRFPAAPGPSPATTSD